MLQPLDQQSVSAPSDPYASMLKPLDGATAKPPEPQPYEAFNEQQHPYLSYINPAVNAGIGVGKSLARVVNTVGYLGQHAVNPQLGMGKAEDIIKLEHPEELGTAQKVGSMAEKVAELFIPVFGEEELGSRILASAAESPTFRELMLQAGQRMAVGAGKGAAIGGGQTALHGGNLSETAQGAVMGAATGGVLEPISSLVPFMEFGKGKELMAGGTKLLKMGQQMMKGVVENAPEEAAAGGKSLLESQLAGAQRSGARQAFRKAVKELNESRVPPTQEMEIPSPGGEGTQVAKVRLKPNFDQIDRRAVLREQRNIIDYEDAGRSLEKISDPIYDELDERTNGGFTALRKLRDESQTMVDRAANVKDLDAAQARLKFANDGIDNLIDQQQGFLTPEEYAGLKQNHSTAQVLKEVHNSLRDAYLIKPADVAERIGGQNPPAGKPLLASWDKLMKEKGPMVRQAIGQERIDNIYQFARDNITKEGAKETSTRIGSMLDDFLGRIPQSQRKLILKGAGGLIGWKAKAGGKAIQFMLTHPKVYRTFIAAKVADPRIAMPVLETMFPHGILTGIANAGATNDDQTY